MDKESLIERGVEFFDKQEYETAIKCFERVLEIEPKNFIALEIIGRAFYLLEKYEKAVQFLSEAVELDNTDPNLLWVKGSALLSIGEYEDAIASFDAALEIKPDFDIAIVEKGVALLYLGKRRKSIDYFNDALKLDPENIDALYNKGIALAELEKYKEAIECMEKVLKIDEENVPAIFEKASYLAETKKYEEALLTIESALKMEPEYEDGWNLKGVILKNLGKYDQALNCFEKVLDLDSGYYTAWENKGDVYLILNKPDKTLACYEEVIEICPEYPWIWLEKGALLQDMGKEKEARDCYEKYVEDGENSDMVDQVTIRRVKDYLKGTVGLKPVSFTRGENVQYWLWVTQPEYYLEDDGHERIALEPRKDYVPGSWWGGAHKDTIFGDLILLYRAGQRSGKSYKDIKYLIMAESSAYLTSDVAYAAEHGWNYACDYKSLFKFENPLTLEEIKKDPYLNDWNAKNANFRGSAFKTEPRHWKRIIELLKVKNPDFELFLQKFDPKKEEEKILYEKEFEDKLAKNLEVIKPFGQDLELIKQQQICQGQGGYIDLYCKDKGDDSLVVVELKIVRANRDTIAQILDYMGWVEDKRAFGKPVKGIVISKGKDTHFDSALRSSKSDIKHIELDDVLNELGLKLK